MDCELSGNKGAGEWGIADYCSVTVYTPKLTFAMEDLLDISNGSPGSELTSIVKCVYVI